MEILYISRDLVAAKKPPMMPSQPDPTGDLDFMSALRDALRERGERDTLFLIHRLDRTVGGVLVFARNKSAAARMITALADEVRVHGIDPEALVGSGEIPVFEKYDDYVPADLLRHAYATDKLNTNEAAARILEIETEF